jgi:hypothetical protein
VHAGPDRVAEATTHWLGVPGRWICQWLTRPAVLQRRSLPNRPGLSSGLTVTMANSQDGDRVTHYQLGKSVALPACHLLIP